MKGARRAFLARCAAAPALVLGLPARAEQDALDHPAVRQLTAGAAPARGRVRLEAPALSATGEAVEVRVTVDSPMSETDRVRRILLVAPENPRPLAAVFRLGARCPRAEVSTRIRLGGSQTVVALAEMSDGSMWGGTAPVVVTLSGCFEGA